MAAVAQAPLPFKEVIAPPETSRNTLFILCIFFSCFLSAGLLNASRAPLWMDEVLATWTARQPTAALVRSAIYHGAEFSPPTYHLLLHYLIACFGSSKLLLRLPSLLAIGLSGLCIFSLVRRYLHVATAAYAVAFLLTGALWDFALQVRPYALLIACFSFALLFWDGLNKKGGRAYRCRVAGICLSLIACISFHFYGVLFVPCLAAAEAWFSWSHRRIRRLVWIALFVSGASTLVWLPLIQVFRGFSSSDTASPEYFAKPTIERLATTYTGLFMFDRKQVFLLLLTFCLLGVIYAWNRTTARPNFALLRPTKETDDQGLYVLGTVLTAFPFIVFLFAVFVVKTFSFRYTLAGAIGLSLLLACVLDHLMAFRTVASFLVLAACALLFVRKTQTGSEFDVRSLLSEATQPYPIVVGEGLRFFELEEEVPKDVKSRLVYVTAPTDARNTDTNNENQVRRWGVIRPDLNIVSPQHFFSTTARFYLLHTPSTPDVITPWLLERGLLSKPIALSGGAWLFLAVAPK